MSVQESRKLAEEIRDHIGADHPVLTTLETNRQVLARVTDGIYREPGSALRELIANAYDADATQVVIKTDAPRFNRIVVEDNGQGMSPEVVAHLVKNIGGSAKRTERGRKFGITQASDVLLSPGGRRLIGKLGIGIFSVSQLTRRFQVVTKVKDDDFRTIIEVLLNQYSEPSSSESLDESYETGKVLIWRESTNDTAEHGTTIVLTDVRPYTRDVLRSSSLWEALDNPPDGHLDRDPTTFLPYFHIGRANAQGDYLTKDQKDEINLPWNKEDRSRVAFKKMVDSVWDFSARRDSNPSLEKMFDNYLRLVWQLGLALPVQYVDGHLFDEEAAGGWAQFYALSNRPKGAAKPIDSFNQNTLVRDLLNLQSGIDSSTPFRVLFDDVEICRPIKFRELPTSFTALQKPYIFLGKWSSDFENLPVSVTAGPLAFEAYFFWNSKIAPVDHRGVLIRIHDASGAPFDNTFFRYQVSEQTRLRQITCEIFVTRGLEAALNIDREAFNTSHAHMVILTQWVHSALRQIATVLKREGQYVREKKREEAWEESQNRYDAIVQDANDHFTGGEAAVPQIEFTGGPAAGAAAVRSSQDDATKEKHSVQQLQWRRVFEADGASANQDLNYVYKVRAIAQVLTVFGALDQLTVSEQEDLLRFVQRILKS